MTEQETQNVWSGMNVTITHIGLEMPGAVTAERRGREVTIMTGMVRAVVVILSANDSDGTVAAQDHFGWPAWRAPAFPERDFAWKAVFNLRNRTFEGFYDESPQKTSPLIVQTPTPQRLTDPMWRMLEESKSTILCVGLTGEPTLQDIATAAQQGQFRGALVEAVLH